MTRLRDMEARIAELENDLRIANEATLVLLRQGARGVELAGALRPIIEDGEGSVRVWDGVRAAYAALLEAQ